MWGRATIQFLELALVSDESSLCFHFPLSLSHFSHLLTLSFKDERSHAAVAEAIRQFGPQRGGGDGNRAAVCGKRQLIFFILRVGFPLTLLIFPRVSSVSHSKASRSRTAEAEVIWFPARRRRRKSGYSFRSVGKQFIFFVSISVCWFKVLSPTRNALRIGFHLGFALLVLWLPG